MLLIDHENDQSEFFYTIKVKVNPSSRMVSMLDYRRRDVLNCGMIGDKRMLFQIQGSDPIPYWTLIDHYGDIRKMPSKLRL